MTVIRSLQSSYRLYELSCDLFEQDLFSCAYMSKQRGKGIGSAGKN